MAPSIQGQQEASPKEQPQVAKPTSFCMLSHPPCIHLTNLGRLIILKTLFPCHSSHLITPPEMSHRDSSYRTPKSEQLMSSVKRIAIQLSHHIQTQSSSTLLPVTKLQHSASSDQASALCLLPPLTLLWALIISLRLVASSCLQ